ncbi:MAG: ATP-binding cassette domain-containing protein [Clostridia bacterium]|nr:ATP-binding cassette domain-containing protein [Clostridia bacterium]
MITIKNLCVKYTKEFYALYAVSLNVKKGEAVALLGEEDSGKTTLLRVLAGLEKSYEGEVYLKDISLKKIDYSCDVEIGYIPAKPIFFEKKTVYENLKYLLKIRKFSKPEIEDKINELLINFNLEKIRDEKVKNLSLFQKYVLSIARLSFRNLEIVLIDDIFSKLNEEENLSIQNLISKQYLQTKTTLLVATTQKEIASSLAKRTVKFKLGSIEN